MLPLQIIQVNMDLSKRCIWFITDILNVNPQSFWYHVPLHKSFHLSSSYRNKVALSKVHVYVKDQPEWQSLQETITAADHIQSEFSKGSLPQLTHKKVGLWYLNGLILNKGMEKYAKSLQELNRCISRRTPSVVQKISWIEATAATPSDWWPCTDRQFPILIGALLSVFFSLEWRFLCP